MTDHEHVTEIIEESNGALDVVCTCGWQDGGQHDEASVLEAAARHQQDVEPSQRD